MKRLAGFFCLIFLSVSSSSAGRPIAAAEETKILESAGPPKRVATGCKFTEGPALDAQGNLYFSDIPNNRIMKLTPAGELSECLKPSRRTNGLIFDARGRLVMCQSKGEGGGRQVVRREKDGRLTVLAPGYGGKPFIAPNDVTIDPRGRIYFTDPFYSGEKPQPSSAVYRIDAPGKVVRLIADLKKPNGILATPDGKLLYVSDRGTQKLHRYRIAADGSLKHDGVVYDFSPDRGIDGMWLDVEGNIYGAAGQGKTTGLFVISPQGKLLLHKPMPEFSTNVVIGGRDGRDLYLTASKSVYHLRTRIAGAKIPPADSVQARGKAAQSRPSAALSGNRKNEPAEHPSARWETAIRKFEEQDKKSRPGPGGVLFVGSSSIRLWKLDEHFPGKGYLNRGFGGSQIADSIYFADRIVLPHKPRTIVMYAGDNDLAKGKSPQQVAKDFRQFAALVHKDLPKTRIVYVAIKASSKRWNLAEEIRQANRLIEKQCAADERLIFVDVFTPMLGADGKPRADLLAKDKLHLSPAGYELWTKLVKPHLR